MYSRRAIIEEKKNRRKAIGLFFLSFLFLGAFMYWGIPLTVQYLGFITDIRRTEQSIDRSDSIPPPKPRFLPIPEATNKQELEVVAISEPGSTITFFVNGDRTELLTNTNGEARLTVNLKDGDNIVYAEAKDLGENTSETSERIVIQLDTTAPSLQVDSPKEGAIYYGARERQLNVNGKTEEDSRLTINGRVVLSNNEGVFNHQVALNNGENTISIQVEDTAGNKTEQQIKVMYYQ